MLPHEELARWYEDVEWVYVCRTWREDAADREAARIHDRFGITSWPHLLVVDPASDEVLVEAGRTVEALDRAFAEASERVQPPDEAGRALLQRLEEARRLHDQGEDERARAALEALANETDVLDVAHEARALLRDRAGADERTLDDRLADPDPEERIRAVEALQAAGAEGDTPARRAWAQARLADPDADVVVRYRVVLWLVGRDALPGPEAIEDLLVSGNDPIRFALLDALAGRAEPRLTPALTRLFAEAGESLPSRNPNVLRSRAARCLVDAGDAGAIDALEPVARAANERNVTTRVVVEALGAIASRAEEPSTRRRVTDILLASYPAAVETDDEEERVAKVQMRYAVALARAVTAALGVAVGLEDLPGPPGAWGTDDRTVYLAAVRQRLAEEDGGPPGREEAD